MPQQGEDAAVEHVGGRSGRVLLRQGRPPSARAARRPASLGTPHRAAPPAARPRKRSSRVSSRGATSRLAPSPCAIADGHGADEPVGVRVPRRVGPGAVSVLVERRRSPRPSSAASSHTSASPARCRSWQPRPHCATVPTWSCPRRPPASRGPRSFRPPSSGSRCSSREVGRGRCAHRARGDETRRRSRNEQGTVMPHGGRTLEGVDEQPGNSGRQSRSGDGIVRNTTFAFAVQLPSRCSARSLTLYLSARSAPRTTASSRSQSRSGSCSRSSPSWASRPRRRASSPSTEAIGSDGSVLRGAAGKAATDGTLVSLALFVAAGPIADLTTPRIWSGRCASSRSPSSGRAFRRFSAASSSRQGRIFVNLRLALASGSVELGTSVVLVLLGAGATGAACGRAAGWLVAAVLGLVFTLRYFGRRAVALRADPAAERARSLAMRGRWRSSMGRWCSSTRSTLC